MKISPSMLACDFSRLGEEARAMQLAGADMLHLDVMDGVFVPNITFGPPVIAALRRVNDLFFDVHLMIQNPLQYIDAFIDAGADCVTFHVEADSDAAETIAKIHARGKRAGLALSPGTPAEAVLPYISSLDLVLVMTVEPGFGGQRFRPEQVDKLGRVLGFCRERGLSPMLQVDGGIDERTAPLVACNGANVLVAGSSLFRTQDYEKAVAGLRKAALEAV